MAIFHLSAKVISRANGRSATAAAAYRSGEKITDERTDQTHDYRNKNVSDSKIIAPLDAPSWVTDRSKLWNAVEKAEKRKDSQVAREIVLALPRELKTQWQKESVEFFVRKNFVDKGMIADVCFHNLGDGQDNPHAHVMLTMRKLDGDKFGKKERSWNDKELLKEWRKSWANEINSQLEIRQFRGVSVDHRTLAAQRAEKLANGEYEAAAELDREPTIHLGPNVIKMKQRGIESERWKRSEQIKERNAIVVELAAVQKKINQTTYALGEAAVQETQRKEAIEAEAQRRAIEAEEAKKDAWRKENVPEHMPPATVVEKFEAIRSEWYGYYQNKAKRVLKKLDQKIDHLDDQTRVHEYKKPDQPRGVFAGFKMKAWREENEQWKRDKAVIKSKRATLKERRSKLDNFALGYFYQNRRLLDLATEAAAKKWPALAQQYPRAQREVQAEKERRWEREIQVELQRKKQRRRGR